MEIVISSEKSTMALLHVLLIQGYAQPRYPPPLVFFQASKPPPQYKAQESWFGARI